MNNNESGLEKIKKELYRKNGVGEKNEPAFKGYYDTQGIKEDWGIQSEREAIKEGLAQFSPPKPSMKKFFIIASIIIVATLAGAAYFIFFGGSNGLSRNVELTMSGSVSVAGGEPASFKIDIKNKNSVAVETSDLILEYPAGVSLKDAPGEEIKRERKVIGEIGSGQSVSRLIDLILLGEENSIKTIKFSLEYRLENSNAIFKSEGSFDIRISQSPVQVSLNFPPEVKTKQEVTFEVEIRSNSENLIKNAYLEMTYPPGFQYLDAEPKSGPTNTRWQLGDLQSGDIKKINIKGMLEGQDAEEKAFHAKVGMLKDGEIVNIYGATEKIVILRKPSFSLSILIDGKDLEKNLAYSGDRVYAEAAWENGLPVNVYDATLTIKVTGAAVDPKSVFASGGFYRSSDDTLVWNNSSFSSLKSIDPGEKKTARFGFNILTPLPITSANDKNFSVKIEGTITGKKIAEEGLENVSVSATAVKEVKIISEAQLSSRLLYSSGPMANSGPLPPKVGQETTFTVIWSLANPSNDISSARVSAVIPSYMRWMGEVLPQDASISYNSSSGEITWNAGKVKAGVSLLNPAREVAFKVSLLPNPTQVGKYPEVLINQAFSWYDDFTQSAFSLEKERLTTQELSDPGVDSTKGRVGQ